jgi:hypothetical protein
MPELVIDFITSLDGYGAPRAGPAGGAWKGPSTSPGWETTPEADSTVLMGANT